MNELRIFVPQVVMTPDSYNQAHMVKSYLRLWILVFKIV